MKLFEKAYYTFSTLSGILLTKVSERTFNFVEVIKDASTILNGLCALLISIAIKEFVEHYRAEKKERKRVNIIIATVSAAVILFIITHI